MKFKLTKIAWDTFNEETGRRSSPKKLGLPNNLELDRQEVYDYLLDYTLGWETVDDMLDKAFNKDDQDALDGITKAIDGYLADEYKRHTLRFKINLGA